MNKFVFPSKRRMCWWFLTVYSDIITKIVSKNPINSQRKGVNEL